MGALKWKVETGKEFHVVPNFFGVGASPVIYKKTSGSQNKLVIVQVGGSARGETPANPQRLDLVKGLDSGLVAFDIENGREVWRTSSELASYSTPLLTFLRWRSSPACLDARPVATRLILKPGM